MRKYILVASLVVAAVAASAQTKVERTDSVTKIVNPGNVEIIESPNGISVKVIGQNDTTVAYSYKNEFSTDVTVITEQQESDFGIDIPFMRNRGKSKSESKVIKPMYGSRWDVTSGGLGFGVNAMLSTPEGMVGYRSAGVEMMYSDVIALRYTPWRNCGLQFMLGVGFQYTKNCLKNGLQFVREDDKQSVGYDKSVDGSSKHSSSIETFSWLLPFDIKYTFSRGWGASVGVWTNFSTSAKIMSSYKLDGIKYNQEWSGINRRKVRVSYVAKINYKDIGVYVKYTPKNMIKEGFGPQFKEISSGIMLMF